MEVKEQALLYYRTAKDESPVKDWLSSLRDVRARQKIQARLGQLRLGNFGKTRAVGSGVVELKIDFGPGYRVYFARHGDSVVILLCGGNKASQTKDIRLAHEYWEHHKACAVVQKSRPPIK